MSSRQRILVFDSGLGGLTVLSAIRAVRPDADYLYLADDALFPYGDLAPEVLIARVDAVIGAALADFPADAIVIACNTASTLVLPPLRARYTLPIIGTVPAIKPAAESTKSGLVSVLATPGTVKRDYTRDLIAKFAGHVAVTLVGCPSLAALCEAHLRGESVTDAAIRTEIAPAFVENGSGKTDIIVLGCTHYPLLLDRLTALGPWPVTFLDPAPAIGRRLVQVLGGVSAEGEGRVEQRFTRSFTTKP